MVVSNDKKVSKENQSGKGVSEEVVCSVSRPRKIEYRSFLSEDDWFPFPNCHIIDCETYNLNSKVRCVQNYDLENNKLYFFYHNSFDYKEEIRKELKDCEIVFYGYKNEKEMIKGYHQFLLNTPKHILGHNVAGFDLAVLTNRFARYNLTGLGFYPFNVGAGMNERRLYFSWGLIPEGEKRVPYDDRYLIADTLYIANALNLPASLRALAKNSPYPKKEIDYSEFAKDELSYEAVLYSIYDVLSLPYVFRDLRKRIEYASKFLKIERLESQRCIEHVWMKGSGALAEAYLNKQIGQKSPYLHGFLTKFFGGLTRDWTNQKVFSEENKSIRNLDLASAYPFSITYQGILDILNGDFKAIENEKCDKETYDKLIYSSVLLCKTSKPTKVLVECERPKDEIDLTKGQWNTPHYVGLGYVKSFDKSEPIQNVQHDFMMLYSFKKGVEFPLTKAEYEMNLAYNPNFQREVKVVRIQDGFIPTSYEKSNEYIGLYGYRRKLKKAKDPSEKGIKVLLNSVYGKMAEMSSKWFNKPLAGAITAKVRCDLFKLLLKAQEKGMELLYSDTDSIYVKASKKQIRELQEYANELNPIPKERYGKDNLEDEGEDIKSFLTLKRKRYIKVFEDDEGRKITVKGGGRKHITWRHILINLVFMTNSYTIEGIKQGIENIFSGRDLPYDSVVPFNHAEFHKLLKYVYQNYKGRSLWDIFTYLSKDCEIAMYDMINCRRRVKYDKGTYHYYALYGENEHDAECWVNQVWKNDLQRNGYTQFDELAELKKYLTELKEEKKKLDKKTNSKWQDFYDLLKDELETEGYGEWFAEEESIRETYSYHFRKLAKYLKLGYDKKNSKFYLNLFEKLREYELSDLINNISPDGVEVIDSPDIENELQYLDNQIEELEERKEELESELKKIEKKIPKEKPYVGLFFPLYNTKYGRRFEDEGLLFTEDRDFSLRYEVYASPPKFMPIMELEEYADLLYREIKIDTLTFIMRDGISLMKLPEKDAKKITYAIYGSKKCAVDNPIVPHCGIDTKNAPPELRPKKQYGGKVLLCRLRFNGVDSIEQIENLKDEKDTYNNVALHVTPEVKLRASLRVNKWGLIDSERNLFSIYKKSSKMQNLAKLWLEDILQKNGVEIDLPEFSMGYQVDVSQENDESVVEDMYHMAWGKPFIRQSINDFVSCEFTRYFVFNGYNKRESSYRKLSNYKMTEKERNYFLKEAEEGWRTEVKFLKQTGMDELLSYAYVFDSLKHETFLKFIEKSKKYYNKVANKFYCRKIEKIRMSARLEGVFGFAKDKAFSLFKIRSMLKGQVLGRGGLAQILPGLDRLEAHGLLHATTCPPLNRVKRLKEKLKSSLKSRIKFVEEMKKEFKSCKIGEVVWFFDSNDSNSINFEKDSFIKQQKLQNGGHVEMNTI